MRYYRTTAGGEPRLVAVDGDGGGNDGGNRDRDGSGDAGAAYDLTAARPSVTDFSGLAHVADVAGESVDDVAARLLDEAEPTTVPTNDDADVPLAVDEVWAAGVTYEISEQAREAESGMPEMYLDVYDAERPELFFKATEDRVVGPGEAIGVRADSEWNVPEPELGVVLHRGEIVGYTVGDDVSSRSIEGENPLYLPQAKVYDRACALGPCVASPETVGDPLALDMRMRIRRAGETVYEGGTSTAEMARTPEELVSYLTRHNHVPETTVLLTGTSLVPEEGFTLREGDDVEIEIDGIGGFETPTTEV